MSEIARTRPPYAAEFCQQVIELAQTGKTPAELPHEFDCTAPTIAHWLGQPGVTAAPASLLPVR